MKLGIQASIFPSNRPKCCHQSKTMNREFAPDESLSAKHNGKSQYYDRHSEGGFQKRDWTS